MKYNGHKNYNHWNVSLWISNDEPLYREAVHTLRVTGNRAAAARRLLNILPPKTPDGAPYSFSSVFAALEGLA
jgi:hypothetical protein